MSATSGDDVTFEFKYLDACPECRSTRIRRAGAELERAAARASFRGARRMCSWFNT
jgi:hypothetical protein